MLGYLECFEFDMITSPSAIHMNPFALAALDADSQTTLSSEMQL